LIVQKLPYGEWKRNPERLHITPGSISITSGVWPDEQTSIEPFYYSVGNDLMALLFTWHQEGDQRHPTDNWLKEFIEHPLQVLGIDDARHWSERMMGMLCMQTSDTSIELYWKDDMLHSRKGKGTPPPQHIPVVEQFADHLSKKMKAEETAMWFEVINKTASAHFIGGMPIAESAAKGVVDPYQRAFGHLGLHVMDGSVMPANPGVNPSLMITGLAERAMSFWPNKGEADPRPVLGSGYNRLKPVMPHKPLVPKGAPAELRLNAKKENVIPLYPY
jgi:cholesterol oxidase